MTTLLGASFAWRRFRRPNPRVWQAFLWGAAALALAAFAFATLPRGAAWADNPAHEVLGVAKGIFPGRVVWVHAPEATSWDRYASAEHWYETNHTDLAVVERMMSRAVRSIGGADSDPAAWDAIFRYFNASHGRGNQGYAAGERIAIKLNLATCNSRSGTETVDIYGTYEKQNAYQDGHWLNTIDNAPQMVLSLLRQLVSAAGVNPTNIYVGDPGANFPKYLWDRLHPEFPGVHYFDNYGGQGRMRTEFSHTRFDWSTNATGKLQDYVPEPFAQAEYIINFAVLKGHSTGVTLCGKNWYGGLLRCPDGYYRDAFGTNQGGVLTNYADMHRSTPLADVGGTPGLGHYRAIVDLLGHPALGGKTLLCLVDGLYGGFYWDSHPYYKWNMPPFNGDWPSSLFVSQDPVAIDSVCYDFLLREWPNIVNNGSESAGNALQGGAEDYLHEAALANSPASGTFYDPGKTGSRLPSLGVHEHWNNATNKQYSRNLGTGLGIELVALKAFEPVLCAPVTLLNGSFEGATNSSGVATNWTAYRRGATPPATTWSLQTKDPPAGAGLFYQQILSASSTGGAGVRQDIAGCTVGATYRVSGWMRGNSGSFSTCTVRVSPSASTNWATAMDLTPAQSVTGNYWTNFSGTVVATDTSMTIWLDGQTTGTGQNKAACFDAVTVTCLGPVAPPPLRARRDGTNFILSWPASYAGYSLVGATNLGTGVTWNAVLPFPAELNGVRLVTNPISGAGNFYRLQSQ